MLPSTQLSTKQAAAKQYALISLGLICFSNLSFHAVLLPRHQYPDYSQQKRSQDALILGAGIAAVGLEISGIAVWFILCGKVSVKARNSVVIHGLVATNVSLMALLVLMPSASRGGYLATILWPLFFTMLAGTVRL
tara:strand:- start:1054 stop:1461 length:408 start_codon:yes stop_codon:yes gene_type:complete